jgi:tetratricopeptide (TPR) repeat protein
MKTLSFIISLSLILVSGFTEPYEEEIESNYRCRFYKAFVTGDMTQWPDWIDQLEEHYSETASDHVLKDIVRAYYGYVAFLIGVERKDKAERYIDEAEQYLDMLKSVDSYQSYAEAMHGAFIAYKIGIKKARAIYLGPRSMNHIKKAIELDPDNPYGWVERGNAEYHMPRTFGGSYETAAEYFLKAINIFEKEKSTLQCNWVYMNTLAWLAQSYDKSGKDKKAEETYQKILSIEPDFKWVKEELYPEFRKSIDSR